MGCDGSVRGPTREQHLLDLVITNIESVSVVVASKNADHAVLLASLNLSISQTVAQWRQVWLYTKADWEELKEADLRDTDWSYIDKCSASESVARTTNLILSCAERHFPRKKICTKKKSHPWLTEKIVQLVAEKHAATGTTEYEAAVKACSAGTLSEYNLYTLDARKKLLEAKSGSKRWWTLSRELLMQRTKVQNMPALKADNGSWMHESAHKAELLANTFNGKNVLPELSENEYTELPRSEHSQNLRNVWSESGAGKVLASLDESSGTGPDLLPSKI